jgi:hypothetical protein
MKNRKESTSSQNAPTFCCVVCGKEKEYVSLGECDHRRVCSYCVMKSRLHYNYFKCPICSKNLDTIIICEFSDKTPFSKFEEKKKELYEDEDFDKTHIYFASISAQEEALTLRGFNCPITSCNSDSFENMAGLNEHLNKVHHRYYCQYCLKENKQFLSEMKIFNYSNLNDHIKYGEYDENGNLLSPPHPSCPFCNTTFYSDENLFTHMNSFHFICQLCKDKKNIIFYPELQNLLDHYKDNHYCCYYDECLSDIYVVFAKEEELVSHLITKHKVENAEERLNKIIFDKKNKKKELHHENGEFNFTEYVQTLKEDSENWKKNNSKRFVNINQQYINDEGIEIIYQQSDKYNKKKNWKKGKYNKKGGDNYYNKYNNYQNYNNEYGYNNNNYHHNNLNEIEEGAEHHVQEVEINDDNIHNFEKKKDFNHHHNEHNEKQDNLDYSFLFSYYLNLTKEFIKNKILSEKIDDKLVKLPKETIYQMIVMLDKLQSNHQLLELTHLNKFGIDTEIRNELKFSICSNSKENESNFKNTLKKLELKKLLLIYQYLLISSKKVDNLFYKLELEQIDEDLYENFCEREQCDDEKELTEAEKKTRKQKILFREHMNLKFKLSANEKKVTEAYKKNTEKKEDKKEEPKKEPEEPKQKSKLYKFLNNEPIEEEHNNNSNTNKNKGKGKKNKKGKFVEFNIHDFDLDKDFPKLKK